MFEQFKRSSLDKLLALHPVSAAGLSYINESLAKPSRNVQGTPFNVISAMPNAKMGMTLESESKDGERPHVLDKTFDDACLGFVTQPKAIELRYRGRNARVVRTSYTPDCLAFYREIGVIVEEWKPAPERDRLHELYPGKYRSNGDGSYGSDPIEAYFRPMGISFRLLFSDQVDGVGHRNRQFLATYLQPAAERSYLAQFDKVLRHFASASQRSVGDLIESKVNLDVLYWAIASGRLAFDMSSVPLATQAPMAQVFRNAATLKAWQAAVRPDGSRPTPGYNAPVADRLNAGDVISLDGVRLTITFVGNTSLIARQDDGSSSSLSFSDLLTAQRDGKLVVPASLGRPTVTSRFYSASSEALDRAMRRVEILGKLQRNEDLPLDERYSPATHRRWRKAIKDGAARGWSPVESLLDDKDQRGFRGSHIDQAVSDELNRLITEQLGNGLVQSKLTKYGNVERAFRERGWTMVAKSSFYERVRKLETTQTVRESRGHKAAHKIEPAFWIINERTPVHGEHAMAWLHIDSTLLDVELRSSLSGEVLGRPWLTLAICANTRRVMGFHLSFLPPSYVSTMMVLADVIRRCGRVPDAVIHDWGSEFRGKDFKQCAAALYMERFTRPKGSPRFGSVIERMFGTTTSQLIAQIAGNTKLRKDVRSLSKGFDASDHSGLYLLDMYVGLEEYFMLYNARKHPTTLLPPDTAYELSLIQQGFRPHRVRSLEELLPVLAPQARASTRVLDPARGLCVNHRYYSNPLLTDRSLGGTQLIVRTVPFDPGLILTFLKGKWIYCRSPLVPEVEKAPEVVRRCLCEEWNIEQRLVSRSADEARRKTNDLIQELNARAIANQEYWENERYQALLDTAVFVDGDADADVPDDAVKRLTDRMSDAVRRALSNSQLGAALN